MKVPPLKVQTIVHLEMPYDMYLFVLYCMATYNNPTDEDAKVLHKNAWEFAESLGAESPHHFIAENVPFMKNYCTQLLQLSSTAKEQADLAYSALYR